MIKMVNKSAVFLSTVIILLMISFAFAQTSSEGDLEEFVKKVAEKKGVPKEDITNVTKVDLNELPKEVNIKDVADSNIGLFRVDSKTGKPAFVITFSEQGFQRVSQPYYAISYLVFGTNEERNSSTFLKMSSGVRGSLEKGYVMTRKGSIVGISTNLEVTQDSNGGSLQAVIYKNGEQVGLGNVIAASSSGVKNDYDIQSRDIVTFNSGDLISVYLNDPEGAGFRDVTTIVEISVPGA